MTTKLLLAIFLITSIPIFGMHEDEDCNEDIQTYYPISTESVKIWALPEFEMPVQPGFVYKPTDRLHGIIQNGNYQHLVERLKTATKHEVNQPDEDGNTPLHIAAGTLSYKKVDLLLKNGASPETKNNAGNTPDDLMPEVIVYIDEPIMSIMQPQFVIAALFEVNLHKKLYEIFESADGKIRF